MKGVWEWEREICRWESFLLNEIGAKTGWPGGFKRYIFRYKYGLWVRIDGLIFLSHLTTTTMSLIIQIIISVVVVYLIFSVIVYVVVEFISAQLQLRGKTLRNAIFKLLADKELGNYLAEKVYNHPQVTKLKKDSKLPSYIPANNVAIALIDSVKEKTPSQTVAQMEAAYQQFRNGLGNLPEGDFKVLLKSVTEHTDKLQSLTASIEQWYNDYMDRVTGWYKKNIRLIVLIVGAIVTMVFNVDSIQLIKVATTDPDTRARMNALADQIIQDSAMVTTLVTEQRNNPLYYNDYVNDSSIQEASFAEEVSEDSVAMVDAETRMQQLKNLNQLVYEWQLPVGWQIHKTHSWIFIVVGWILTTLALSFGAPFWFDLLKRLVNIRNAGLKPSAEGVKPK
jgi:hypothetical protein